MAGEENRPVWRLMIAADPFTDGPDEFLTFLVNLQEKIFEAYRITPDELGLVEDTNKSYAQNRLKRHGF